jgi:hypothetical protein
MIAVLLDVFVTVLYARSRMGIISFYTARAVWRLFYGVAHRFERYRGAVMSYCGPAILVAGLLVWVTLLSIGAGLVIHPALGSSVTSASGDTPDDLVAALFAGASSISIVGVGDFTPHTNGYRVFDLFGSVVGAAVLSLTLTYLMQVYTGLQRRNTLALSLHLASAETGDAAELLARLGPRGQFEGGYSNLSTLASEMATVKEEYHHFPILFYFRFREPFYGVSRTSLIALDLVSLICCALDDDEFAWLRESVAVSQLWRATMLLITSLDETFLSGGTVSVQNAPDPASGEAWRHRYRLARQRLAATGIRTQEDEEAGVAEYIRLRSQWDRYITVLAPVMAYTPADIDPVLARQPQEARSAASRQ